MDRNKNLILVLDKNPVLKIQVNEKTTLGQILELANNFLLRKGIPVQNYTVTLKFDDKHYVPNYVLRDQNFMKSSIYKQLKSDQSVLMYDKTFTGISDLDMKILNELDDRSLMQTCLINTYVANLCNNDNLWRNRYIKRFGTQNLHYKDEIFQDVSWKYIYLLLISEFDFDTLNNDNVRKYMWPLFDHIMWSVRNKFFFFLTGKKQPKDLNDKIKFYFGQLPIKYVEFNFQVDRNLEADTVEKKYKTDSYFTSNDLMNYIVEFYHSPLTIEEFKDNIDSGNPDAEDYKKEEVKEGKVLRYQMLVGMNFEGFDFRIPVKRSTITESTRGRASKGLAGRPRVDISITPEFGS